MLTPHATMLATLDIESSWNIRGMPHDGLIPTGADEVGIESPVSVSKRNVVAIITINGSVFLKSALTMQAIYS
jgi:hypothetical protein